MIGLFFGDTDFPKEILKEVKKKKIDYLIIDLSKSKKFKKDKKSHRKYKKIKWFFSKKFIS